MWGVAKHPDQPAREFDTWDAFEAVLRGGAVVWCDLAPPTADELLSLGELIDLDERDAEDALLGEPRPHIEDFERHLLIVAYGVIVPEGQRELESRQLTLLRGDRFLVTIHNDPSRSVAAMRKRCEKHADKLLDQGVDQMVYRLIDGMVDRYLTLLDQYELELEQFETESLEADVDRRFLDDAGRIRRHLIEIRRLTSAQRSLLDPLADGDFDHVSEDLSRKFRVVRSHLLHASDRVVGLQERLNAAVQNYTAMVAERTNDIVRTLTVLTAVMMPLSLIAGVYGMNLPVWPPGDAGASFWWVVGAMGAIAAGMLGLFRWLKWV